MLRQILVNCNKCVDGIITKHYADTDEQGNKIYYTEPCDCQDGHRIWGHIDLPDIDISDLYDKINDINDKIIKKKHEFML